MHIFWIYNRQLLKNAVRWYFCQAHFMLFVLKPKQREDNSYNLPIGQSKFSYELKFYFISIENGGKQKQ